MFSFGVRRTRPFFFRSASGTARPESGRLDNRLSHVPGILSGTLQGGGSRSPWVGEKRAFRCDQVGGKHPSASVSPTLRQTWPRVGPEAAMCVRKISAQCVLQFTPSLAAGCVLHRPVSRVIHCSELFFFFADFRPFCMRSRGYRDPPFPEKLRGEHFCPDGRSASRRTRVLEKLTAGTWEPRRRKVRLLFSRTLSSSLARQKAHPLQPQSEAARVA